MAPPLPLTLTLRLGDCLRHRGIERADGIDVLVYVGKVPPTGHTCVSSPGSN
jgi:hypothetical protein